MKFSCGPHVQVEEMGLGGAGPGFGDPGGGHGRPGLVRGPIAAPTRSTDGARGERNVVVVVHQRRVRGVGRPADRRHGHPGRSLPRFLSVRLRRLDPAPPHSGGAHQLEPVEPARLPRLHRHPPVGRRRERRPRRRSRQQQPAHVSGLHRHGQVLNTWKKAS